MRSSPSSLDTGMLIIAHTPLASALKACVTHIQPSYSTHISTYDVAPNASLEQELKTLLKLAQQNHFQQLLLLTDIVGATPYNLAQTLLNTLYKDPRWTKPVQLISGVNMSMLLRTLTYHHKPLDELIELALSGAKDGIQCFTDNSLD